MKMIHNQSLHLLLCVGNIDAVPNNMTDVCQVVFLFTVFLSQSMLFHNMSLGKEEKVHRMLFDNRLRCSKTTNTCADMKDAKKRKM